MISFLFVTISSHQNLTEICFEGSSLSRVSSSSPSSTTPTEAEGISQSYHSPAHATSSELEDEAPPPPIASRPERTKSIVSNCFPSAFLFNPNQTPFSVHETSRRSTDNK